jgi:hypothetical protein
MRSLPVREELDLHAYQIKIFQLKESYVIKNEKGKELRELTRDPLQLMVKFMSNCG